MDALDNMIAEKRVERAGLLERARLLDTEIAALEMAAQLRPILSTVRPPPASDRPIRKGGGRKKGDISHAWRNILADAYRQGRAQGYNDISAIAESQGNPLASSSVRDRIRNLVETGLMAGDPRSGFTVTENAVERFGFTKENGPSEGGPDVDAGGVEASPASNSQPSLEGV